MRPPSYALCIVLGCIACSQQPPILAPAGSRTIPLASALPSTLVTWPWPQSRQSSAFSGVTQWTAESSDHTSAELYRFDFGENPNLRFGLYDHDEDDDHPFDNVTNYGDQRIDWVAKHLAERERCRVVLAWNGLFFAHANKPNGPPGGFATHIGPVVIDGKSHYNVGQHRWTFGVSYDSKSRPIFRAVHMPDKKTLATFTYAADGAQCLIQDGKPLKLPAATALSAAHPRGGVPATDTDVGSIPVVDDLKTSRTSIAWSKDNRYLYVLIVFEPDSEGASILAFREGKPQTGGWSLADEQAFWQMFEAWGAINSDGGVVTQRAFLNRDGTYVSRFASTTGNSTTGSLMSFYVLLERGAK